MRTRRPVKAKVWGKTRIYRGALIAPQRQGDSKTTIYVRKNRKGFCSSSFFWSGHQTAFQAERKSADHGTSGERMFATGVQKQSGLLCLAPESPKEKKLKLFTSQKTKTAVLKTPLTFEVSMSWITSKHLRRVIYVSVETAKKSSPRSKASKLWKSRALLVATAPALLWITRGSPRILVGRAH